MTTGKTIALTRRTFVDKVVTLLFNMLSRLAIAFLSRSKCLLISWLQSPCAVILEPPKVKPVTVSIVSPSIFHEVMGLDAMILMFWMLSFTSFFTLLFHFHQEALQFLFAFCHRVVSSAYLRLLIFLTAILIPACASSSPAFHMIYSAYKLNKQADSIQPWHIPFQFGASPLFHACPVLTVASWPAYRFLRRQIRWSGIPISLKIFHSLLWSTQSKALTQSIKQK